MLVTRIHICRMGAFRFSWDLACFEIFRWYTRLCGQVALYSLCAFLSVRSVYRSKDQTIFSGMHQTQKAKAQLIRFYLCLSCVLLTLLHSLKCPPILAVFVHSLHLLHTFLANSYVYFLSVIFFNKKRKKKSENNGLLNHNKRNIELSIFTIS